MKSKVGMAILMLGAAVLPVSAQRSSYFGVRASFDVTHPAGFSDGVENGSGFTLTGIYNLPLGQNFYLEPGVGVYYNTMTLQPVEINDRVFSGSVRNSGFRIPLNVGYRVGLFEGLDVAVYTGPWFNINAYTRSRLQPDFEVHLPDITENLLDYGWRKFDAQWGFGVTITYADSYYIGVSGGLGMSAMARIVNDGHDDYLRRNTLSITAGYNF